ncbi:hypothetical protein NN561_017699 [Cricetulus griseus]
MGPPAVCEPAARSLAPRAPITRVSALPQPYICSRRPKPQPGPDHRARRGPERWVTLESSERARAAPLLTFLTETSTELSHRWCLCKTGYCLLISQDRKRFVLFGHDLQLSTWGSGC